MKSQACIFVIVLRNPYKIIAMLERNIEGDNMKLEQINEHVLVRWFRSDARIILLEQDELLLNLRMNTESENNEELIHDIRVNFRRLISLISFHEPLLKKKEYMRLSRELNLMLRSFAMERTNHVFMNSMEKYLEGNGNNQTLKEIVLRELPLKKRPDRDPLEPLLFRVTYEGTLKTLLGYGGNIFRGGALSLEEHPENFYSNRYQELMHYLKKLEENLDFSDKKSVHRLRVTAKNIYYTLKAKEEILGELASRRAAYLKEIHSIGGKIHDADVNLGILSKFTVKDQEQALIEGFADYLHEERSRKISALKDLIHTK